MGFDLILIAAALLLIVCVESFDRNWPARWPISFLIVALLLFACPNAFLSIAGGSLSFFSVLWLVWLFISSLPASGRKWKAITAIVLAILVILCTGYGLRPLHDVNGTLSEKQILTQEFWEGHSRLAYEIAQVFALNMSVHDGPSRESSTTAQSNQISIKAGEERDVSNGSTHVNRKPVRWALTLARWLAVILAVFLAFQTLLYIFRDAVARLAMAYHGRKISTTDVALVIGLGYVGLQIAQALRKQNKVVIAVEPDTDNRNIEKARRIGVIVVEGDATQGDVLDELPLHAADEIFISSGNDQRNMTIALLLQQAVHKKKKSHESGTESVLQRILARLQNFLANLPTFLTDRMFWLPRWSKEPVCYVRLHDPDLHQVLYRRFQSDHQSSSLKLNVFNSDQNAARDLVQRHLSSDRCRPTYCAGSTKEVAQYIVVGFEAMGQEVALALGHLAHYDNLLRSRILILDDQRYSAGSVAQADTPDCESVTRFLTRYPKFTKDVRGPLRISDVKFDDNDDDWNVLKDETNPGLRFATNSWFSYLPPCPSSNEFLKKIRELVEPSEHRRPRPAIIVCLEDESLAFAWASRFEQAWTDYCYRNDIHTTVPHLPIFVWAPEQGLIRQFVDDSAQQSASPNSANDASLSRPPNPPLQNQHKEPTAPGDDDEQSHFVEIGTFGEEERSTSIRVLDGKSREQLSKVVSDSYGDSRSAIKDGADENPKITALQNDAKPEGDGQTSGVANSAENNPAKTEAEKRSLPDYPPIARAIIDFGNRQSNLQAADHASIKFAIAGGEYDVHNLLVRKEIGAALMKELLAQSQYEQAEHEDDKYGKNRLLWRIAWAEHNRWSAEILLRDYEWVKKEVKREYSSDEDDTDFKERRIPSHIFRRKTLVSWERLIDNPDLNVEKMKDIDQVYAIVKKLNDEKQTKTAKSQPPVAE